MIVGWVRSTTETRWTQRSEKTSLLEISRFIVPHDCGNRWICTAEIRRTQRITFRSLLSNRRPALCGGSNLVIAGWARSTTETRWTQRSEKTSLLEISGFIVPHDCGNRWICTAEIWRTQRQVFRSLLSSNFASRLRRCGARLAFWLKALATRKLLAVHVLVKLIWQAAFEGFEFHEGNLWRSARLDG